MVKNIDAKVLGKIVEQVPIGRLIEPEEVVSLVAELYRNEAMAGETVLSTAVCASAPRARQIEGACNAPYV